MGYREDYWKYLEETIGGINDGTDQSFYDDMDARGIKFEPPTESPRCPICNKHYFRTIKAGFTASDIDIIIKHLKFHELSTEEQVVESLRDNDGRQTN